MKCLVSRHNAVFLVFMLSSVPCSQAAEVEASQMRTLTNWAAFVEADFPFFSSVLDARGLGDGWPTNNLTPRGLILNLRNDCWACFDTELLRMSAIWQGAGVTPVSLSQGSYNDPGHKAPEGQEKLPRIAGELWMATGIYPGWQSGEQSSLSDPRESGPDPREVGRGPLPEPQGRLKAVQLLNHLANGPRVRLEYDVHGTRIQESVFAVRTNGEVEIERRFRLDRVGEPLWLLLGKTRAGCEVAICPAAARKVALESRDADGCVKVRVGPVEGPIEFCVRIERPSSFLPSPPKEERETIRSHPSDDGSTSVQASRERANWPGDIPPLRRWPESVVTQIRPAPATNAFVIDEVALPLNNPWRRNVRLADIAFFKDGRAAVVTFDGDIWLVEGLASASGKVTWRRFASGFHEPLSLSIRNGELFVFDRNGIWKVIDTDENGEADRHELFCNAFAQTAETREFANGMRMAPDGSFIVAKGGQQESMEGKLNGTVLRVLPDGKDFSVLGSGLRQAFIGVHPKTGLVTASDQQGHYVPATPLHVIRDRQYYGFLASFQPKEQYPAPIADPLVWIPHPVNASGAGQVWLTGARMGPLNETLIHIAYSRSELFLVRFNNRTAREAIGTTGERPGHGFGFSQEDDIPLSSQTASNLQAAVVSVTQNLDFPPLNGAVNPDDGQLYVAGFQIWGSTAPCVSGLARLRYTGEPCTLPREIAAMDKGLLLRFDVPLDATKASDPDNFSAERWNYKRTAKYGSPHFKLDGTPGQEWLTPSSAYVSSDRKAVFVGIPDMKPVMQMRFGWALRTPSGRTFEQNAWLTPYHLTRFDAKKEGFDRVEVDLTPRAGRKASTPVTIEQGQKLASLMGCIACHSVDGSTAGRVGPTWKGLFGSQVEIKDGEPAVADEAYLRESILDPTAKVVQGFDKSDAGMPSYAGVLTEDQIQALILYIKNLH